MRAPDWLSKCITDNKNTAAARPGKRYCLHRKRCGAARLPRLRRNGMHRDAAASGRLPDRRRPRRAAATHRHGCHRNSEMAATRRLERIGRQPVQDAVDCYARKHGYHPVREYLADLQWDGTRAGRHLAHKPISAPSDTDYTQAVGKMFLDRHVREDHRARLQERPHAGARRTARRAQVDRLRHPGR